MKVFMRLLPVVLVAALSFTLVGTMACDDDKKPAGKAPSRFDSVKSESAGKANALFCEKSFKPGERKFVEPAERAIPGVAATTSTKPGWRWVNLWATWCHPCVEEMGLLGKWEKALAKDGVPVTFDLYSVDDDESALTAWLKKTTVPGRARWLASSTQLDATLESLGVDKGSAIPVHALVDPQGSLHCVRVGSVHEEDYGAIKTILTGG
jgi:thiol-disulfide isomerase/thioredoxin